MEKPTRNKELRIRVSENEYNIIQYNAKLYGFHKMPDYMRSRAMNYIPEEVPIRNICQANELLQKIRNRHSDCKQTQEDVGNIYALINNWGDEDGNS